MRSTYKPHTNRLRIVYQYINKLFKDELHDGVKYHNASHTLHPSKGVAAVANRIAISEKISEHDRELLITAAYFHDAGYIRAYGKNEPIAARMAGRILKLVGYKQSEIKKIQSMILSTGLDREPKRHLEKILCDADLDHFGTDEFFKVAQKVRIERQSRGIDVSNDERWINSTIELLKKHKFHTNSQIELREKKKQENLIKLKEKLKILQNKSS